MKYPGSEWGKLSWLWEWQVSVRVFAPSRSITQLANAPAGLITGTWLSGVLWERGGRGRCPSDWSSDKPSQFRYSNNVLFRVCFRDLVSGVVFVFFVAERPRAASEVGPETTATHVLYLTTSPVWVENIINALHRKHRPGQWPSLQFIVLLFFIFASYLHRAHRQHLPKAYFILHIVFGRGLFWL